MAGAANPSMVQGGGPVPMGPNAISGETFGGGGNVSTTSAPIMVDGRPMKIGGPAQRGGGPVQGGMGQQGIPTLESLPRQNPVLMGQQMPSASPVSNNPYQQAAGAQQAALAATQAGMGYMPERVRGTGYQAVGYGSTGYDASQMAGPSTAASGMAAYQNPYEQQVVDATLRDIGGAQQSAMNQIGQQATAAKAFGGSRHGIAEAESNKAFNQQALDAAARLRSQGFQTALGASQFDVGQQQAARQANMMAENQARQFGASASNQAAQFGATAANQARQFGAQNQMTAQQLNQAAGLQGNQQRLGAAQQMGNLGQQSFGYGQAIQNQQMQQGAMQQQMMQNLINAGKGMFQGYTQQPSQNLGSLFGAITGSPNVSGQSTSFNPGLFNYMQMFAGM